MEVDKRSQEYEEVLLFDKSHLNNKIEVGEFVDFTNCGFGVRNSKFQLFEVETYLDEEDESRNMYNVKIP